MEETKGLLNIEEMPQSLKLYSEKAFLPVLVIPAESNIIDCTERPETTEGTIIYLWTKDGQKWQAKWEKVDE